MLLSMALMLSKRKLVSDVVLLLIRHIHFSNPPHIPKQCPAPMFAALMAFGGSHLLFDAHMARGVEKSLKGSKMW